MMMKSARTVLADSKKCVHMPIMLNGKAIHIRGNSDVAILIRGFSLLRYNSTTGMMIINIKANNNR
jgi:hypothetical protein